MGATPGVLPTVGGVVGGGGGGEPAVAAVAAMVGVSALVTAAERGDALTNLLQYYLLRSVGYHTQILVKTPGQPPPSCYTAAAGPWQRFCHKSLGYCVSADHLGICTARIAHEQCTCVTE